MSFSDVFERLAEAVLVVALAEFAGERLGQLFGHHLDAGAEAVAGLEDAGEEVERFGELRGDWRWRRLRLLRERR